MKCKNNDKENIYYEDLSIFIQNGTTAACLVNVSIS